MQAYCNISFSVSQMQTLTSPDPFLPDSPPRTFWISCARNFSVLAHFKRFYLWYDFSLLLELLLYSTMCFSLAFFLLRISLFYQNSYFCDAPPGPVEEVLVLGLVPREESEAKAIVLAVTTELEVPVSWRASGETAGKD